MVLFTEGCENGYNKELAKPAVIKKDNILFIAYGIAYFVLFIIGETIAAFVTFLKNLIFRPEPKSLKGRVCLVTGAGRGLGRELCLALAKEGAVVACADINEPNNRATATMIKELGGKAVPYTLNVAIKKDVEELVAKIEKELGPIYLLINNAAIVGNSFSINEKLLRASFNVNVFGPIWLMNAVLPSMKLRNEGHIVNICSVANKMTFSPLNVYGSTKASLYYMSKCVRIDLQLSNDNNDIKVTTVHPSIMNSSEDYTSQVLLNINIIVEMEDVVKATMDAIHYNHDEVIVPQIMKYGLLVVNELLPSQTGTKLIKLLFKKITLPRDDRWQLQPSWNYIVSECSFMEDKKESSLLNM